MRFCPRVARALRKQCVLCFSLPSIPPAPAQVLTATCVSQCEQDTVKHRQSTNYVHTSREKSQKYIVLRAETMVYLIPPCSRVRRPMHKERGQKQLRQTRERWAGNAVRQSSACAFPFSLRRGISLPTLRTLCTIATRTTSKLPPPCQQRMDGLTCLSLSLPARKYNISSNVGRAMFQKQQLNFSAPRTTGPFLHTNINQVAPLATSRTRNK